MHKILIEWLNENKLKLLEMGIETENVRVSPDNSIDQAVTVEQLSKTCIGQVSIWRSGLIDIEILDIETERRLLYEHYELTQVPDFNKLFKKYIKIMKNGIVE